MFECRTTATAFEAELSKATTVHAVVNLLWRQGDSRDSDRMGVVRAQIIMLFDALLNALLGCCVSSTWATTSLRTATWR